jgi:hypothetical protein
MSQLGIILDFDRQTITWDESTIKMKEYKDLSKINSLVSKFYWHEESYESQALNDATSCLKKYKMQNQASTLLKYRGFRNSIISQN